MKPFFRALPLTLAVLASALPAHGQTPSPSKAAAAPHLGVGVVRNVDAKARTLTISHQAMPSLRMGAMTMDFLVARDLHLKDVKEGDTVAFVLGRHGKSDDVAIVAFQKVETAASAAGAPGPSMPMMMSPEKCREMMAPRK